MEILSSPCENCYGLATNCFNCCSVGSQTLRNTWDLDNYLDFENFLDPGLSSVTHEPSLLGGAYANSSELARSSLQPNCDLSIIPNAILSITRASGSDKTSFGKPAKDIALESGEEMRKYRRHTKSAAQVKLLKEWFENNPTPTGPQLSVYANLAGLEKDQVRNWFINQRRPGRRTKSKIIAGEARALEPNRISQKKENFWKELGPNAIASAQPMPIAGYNHSSSLTDSLRSVPDMPESMLERWQNSPPKEEPADLSAIRNAVNRSQKLQKKSSSARVSSYKFRPENNVTILIKNIPRDMKMDQFVKVMLRRGIRKPRTFHYEFTNGKFCGLGFAEFRSKKDALFAITKLHHSLLEECTLRVQLELPLPDDSELDTDPTSSYEPLNTPWGLGRDHCSQKQAIYQEKRNNYRPSPTSTDGSVVSSAHSNSSSISLARRRYKRLYRKVGRSQSHLPSLASIDQNIPLYRPSALVSPLTSPEAGAYESDFFVDSMDLEDINNVCVEKQEFQGDKKPTQRHMDHSSSLQYHFCQRYHCGSCIRKFNTEEEWRSHETLIHRPREEWICSLVPYMRTSNRLECVFCHSLFQKWPDLAYHRCRPCGTRPTSTSKPVFNTRTELAHHVELHHRGAALTSFMIENWSRPPTWEEGIWPCDTCGASIQGWENRLDHLAGHHDLEISKKKCSCLSSLRIEPNTPGIDVREKATVNISKGDPDETQDELLMMDDAREWVPSSINPSDRSFSTQDRSYGFISQARAWITKKMRRP